MAAVNLDFYPTGIRIGALEDGREKDLLEIRTGDSFDIGDYRVSVLRLDPLARTAYLDVYSSKGNKIGSRVTDRRWNLPPGFPFDFKLVAFQDPQVRRMWVDLELRKNRQLLVECIT